MDNEEDQMDPRAFVPDNFSQTIGNQVAASFAYARDNLLLSLQRQQQIPVDQRMFLGLVSPAGRGQAPVGYGGEAERQQQFLQESLPLNLRQAMSSVEQNQTANFAMLLNSYPSTGVSTVPQAQHRNVTAAAGMDERHSYSPHHFTPSPMGHSGSTNQQRSFSPSGYALGGAAAASYAQQYAYMHGGAEQMGDRRPFSPENLTQNGCQQQQQAQVSRATFINTEPASSAAAAGTALLSGKRKTEKRASAQLLHHTAPGATMQSTELQRSIGHVTAAQQDALLSTLDYIPAVPVYRNDPLPQLVSSKPIGQILAAAPGDGSLQCSCPVCDFACSDTEGLKHHMLTVHDVQSIAPEPPNEGSVDRVADEGRTDETADVKPPRGLASGLLDVFSVKAAEYNKFVCVDCGAEFKNKDKLIAHVRKHTDMDTLLCTLCGKSFFKSDKLARHMLVHSGERPYVCRHCGATFTRSDKLRHHLRERHDDTSHTCRVCRESFSDAVELKLHLSRRACRKYRPSETEEDERRRLEREALENSFNAIAAELGDPEIDLTVMLNKDRLAATFDETLKVGGALDTAAVVKEIVAVPEDPVMPPQGLFAEYAAGAMNEAARAKAAHARSLERIIKKINKYRTVSCPHCGLRLPGAYTMTRHLRVAHNIVKTYEYKKKEREPGEPRERVRVRRPALIKFCQCQVCGKSFSKVDTLKRHEVTHTGERNFQCRFCDAKYSRSDRLRKHLRSSHVAAAYPCIRCDAVFDNKQELRAHISVHRVRSERPERKPKDGKKRIRGPYKKRKMKLGTSADVARSVNGGSAYASSRAQAAGAPVGGPPAGDAVTGGTEQRGSEVSNTAGQHLFVGSLSAMSDPPGDASVASNDAPDKPTENVFRLSAAELTSSLVQRNQGRALHRPVDKSKTTPKSIGEAGEARVKRKYTKRKERKERKEHKVRKERVVKAPRDDGKPRPFECRHCAVRYTRFNKLQAHLVREHNDRLHECRCCDEIFGDVEELRKHEATHGHQRDVDCTKGTRKGRPKSAAKVYTCCHCRKVFDSKHELKVHVAKHRSTAVSKLDDSETEDDDADWVPEEKARRGGGNPLYEDAVLSLCAAREQAISVVGKFKRGRKPGTLNSRGALGAARIKMELGEVSIKQEREEDGYERKPYADGLGFSADDLPLRVPGGGSASDTITIDSDDYKGDVVPRRHAPVRGGKGMRRPPHRCAVCNKTFRDVLLLQRHVERHDRQRRHRDKLVQAVLRNKRPYHKMSALAQQAERQKKLALQRRRAEPLTVSADAAGTGGTKALVRNARGLYQCSICSLSFSMVAKLRRHMAVHTGEKPYVCRHCAHTFSRSDKLRTHLTTAHGDLSSSCLYCAETFETKAELRAHTITHEEHRQIRDANKLFSHETRVSSTAATEDLSEEPLPGIKKEASDGFIDSFFSSILGSYGLPRQKRSYTPRKKRTVGFVDADDAKAANKEMGNEAGQDGDEDAAEDVKKLRGPLAGDKHLHCPICDKGVSSQHALKRHVTCAHTDDRPYVCCDCPRSFSRMDKFRNHLRRHYGFIYPCTVCGETFLRWYHWKKHTLTHTMKCELCDFTCVNISSMGRHIARHTGQKQFTCAFCSKQFWRNYHLQIHTRIHTGEMPYSCDKCGRRFFRSDRLKRHLESHDRDAGLLCSTCGKSFSSNLALKVHAHIHDAVVPQQCHLCDLTLPNPIEMRRHRKKVHPGETLFVCSVCNESFRTHAELLSHSSAVHLEGEALPPLEGGLTLSLTPLGGGPRVKPPSKQPFLCSMCGRQLSSCHALVRHQRIHTGERNHTCQYCAQQFTTNYGLRRHVEKHERSGDAPTTVKKEVGGGEPGDDGGLVPPQEGAMGELSRPQSAFADRGGDGAGSFVGLPSMPAAQTPRYIGDLAEYAATPGGMFELLQGVRLDPGVRHDPGARPDFGAGAARQPLDLAKMASSSGLNNYN